MSQKKCHSKNVTAKSDGNSTDAKSRSKVQLNECQKQIVELVKRNPNILQTELADHFVKKSPKFGLFIAFFLELVIGKNYR